MVANLVSLLWLSRRNRQQSRVLYVVPRRVLVDQHHYHAKWLSGMFRPTKLAAGIGGNTPRIQREVEQGRIVVTTPGLLSESIRRGRIPDDLIKSIDLVVIDEVDALMTVTWVESGLDAQLHRSLEGLLEQLVNPQLLLLTATPPRDSAALGDEATHALANCVKLRLGVSNWKSVDRNAYARYIPRSYVTAVTILDEYAIDLGRALDDEIGFALNQIDAGTDSAADHEYILQRHHEISSGRIARLKTVFGGWIPLDSETRRLVREVTRRIQQRTFLFEDMMKGFETEEATVPWWVQERADFVPRQITRVLSPTGDGHYPDLRNKLAALTEVVDSHRGESGVIFVRYLRLGRALVERLSSLGMRVSELNGDMDDERRVASLQAFRSQDADLLVMTRDTGKRGLDIPESDFALFYSPKTSERTMWQETSWIRATTTTKKPSYILVYEGTKEVQRYEFLRSQMAAHPRRWEITEITA